MKQLRRTTIGVAILVIQVAVVACSQDNPDAARQKGSPPDADTPSNIEQIEKQLGPADVKSFGGSDELPIGGPLASISIPQSGDEKRFLADFGCVAEVDCYGPIKFERYILKTYPDIRKIRFKLPPDLADEDEADVIYTKQDFRRGLYFAK